MKALAWLLLFAVNACAADYYMYSKSTTLAGAVETITVQQPSSSAKRVDIYSATVYCSVTCTITLKRDGTAATTTAGTVTALSADYPTARANVFHTSNVGSGTTLTSYVLAAGQILTIDLEGISLTQASTARNFSIATSSITGNVTLAVSWRER
jgi:hypothetical protein